MFFSDTKKVQTIEPIQTIQTKNIVIERVYWLIMTRYLLFNN